MLVPVTGACLLILFVLCMVGAFYEGFEDNWMQRIGLCMIGVLTVLKADQLYGRGSVSYTSAAFIFGTTFYACGVAYKVWDSKRRHRRGERVDTIKS